MKRLILSTIEPFEIGKKHYLYPKESYVEWLIDTDVKKILKGSTIKNHAKKENGEYYLNGKNIATGSSCFVDIDINATEFLLDIFQRKIERNTTGLIIDLVPISSNSDVSYYILSIGNLLYIPMVLYLGSNPHSNILYHRSNNVLYYCSFGNVNCTQDCYFQCGSLFLKATNVVFSENLENFSCNIKIYSTDQSAPARSIDFKLNISGMSGSFLMHDKQGSLSIIRPSNLNLDDVVSKMILSDCFLSKDLPV